MPLEIHAAPRIHKPRGVDGGTRLAHTAVRKCAWVRGYVSALALTYFAPRTFPSASHPPDIFPLSRNDITARLGIVGELLLFLWQRRLWWLIPMVVMLLALGALLVFAHGSAVAPFIYTLF